MAQPLQLIVGLGNPGPTYAATRHNVGVWLITKLAAYHNLTLRHEAKFNAAIAQMTLGDHACWLMQPSTYMNESGQAVAAVARFYKIPAEAILIAHDELDFAPGLIRFKQNGGHGGHNGLRDIVDRLATTNFSRLRIGIGHPGERHQVTSYVLSPPSVHDRKIIDLALDEVLPLFPELVGGDWEKIVQAWHTAN